MPTAVSPTSQVAAICFSCRSAGRLGKNSSVTLNLQLRLQIDGRLT
jgi:hypothetical protein